jgi:hypothetical protein
MTGEISKFYIHLSVLGTLCYTIRGKKTTVTGTAEHIKTRVELLRKTATLCTGLVLFNDAVF